MSGLPNDIQQRIARCLASKDVGAAKKLAGDLAAAMAVGDAHGFEGDLAALKKLCGGDAPGLGKLAKGGHGLVLPADLRGRAEKAVQAYENASDDVAKAAAERELRLVHGDMLARDAMAKCFASPQKMGVLLP